MKTRKLTQLLTLVFAAIAFAFVTSCEGPAGPAGPAGADGTDGTDGINGTNGVDGNVTCLECHGTENMETIGFQFATSQHNSGSIAVDYAGTRSDCAQCHSHEGFVEWAANGSVAANLSNPSAWKCQTCHNVHTTFEATDYAFRAGEAVTLMAVPTVTLDEGNNNTCINCHQARRAVTYYDNLTEAKTYVKKFTKAEDIALYTTAAVGPAGSIVLDQSGATDTLVVTFDVPLTYAYISSSHAGPHLGPQSDIWAGVNGTLAGTAYGPHSDGCVKCHMGPESGHSFKPETGNCVDCHTANEKQPAMDAVAARIEAAGEALELIHAVHADRDAMGKPIAWHPMYASLTKAQFNAWWDFSVILEDRSNGAHNPTYVKALLDGIESALGI